MVGAWSVGAGDEASSRALTKLGKNPAGQSLKRQTNAVLTGKRQCQPRGKQGAENERGGHGKEISMGEEGIWCSVPAAEFGHIDSHPPVIGKVEKLNFTKESCRNWLEREPPCVWGAAEIEAGHKKTKTHAGLGAGDQREVLDVVGGCAGWDRDPDQTLLGFGRDQLASSSRDRALGGGRFPLAGSAEPRDRFFVGWNVGGAGLDVA